MTLYAELSAPFAAKDIEWRIGRKSKDGKKAAVLCYLDARAVMDRLDTVMGPNNWQDSYHFAQDGSVICTLSLRFDAEWISKADGAEKTNIEATKGGISGAFKRAAVKWGIGRYMYDIPDVWVVLKNEYGDFDPPQLPKWSLPHGDTSAPRAEKVNTETGEITVNFHLGSSPSGDGAQDAYDDAMRDLPAMDAAPKAKVSKGVPDFWPHYRQLIVAKHIPDSAVEKVIGTGPTMAAVEKWLDEHPDVNFTQLVRLAEEAMGNLMGAR